MNRLTLNRLFVNGNLYHYAGNNPVKYVDPTGLTTEDGAEATVIIYYNRKDQKEFKKAAETAAKSYPNQDNTYLIGVYTADDFKFQWSSLNTYLEVNNIKVGNMEIFCMEMQRIYILRGVIYLSMM